MNENDIYLVELVKYNDMNIVLTKVLLFLHVLKW